METSTITNTQTPKEAEVVVRKPKKGFNIKYLVEVLVFLIVCLVGGLTYYILKDNGVNLFSQKAADTTVNKDSTNTDTDTSKAEESESSTCTTVGETCKVSVGNSGWALFALPKYNFSVEVPSYTMTQKLPETTFEGTKDVDIQSVWKVGHEDSDKTFWLNNYVHSAWLSFYPERIPEGFGCGQGCVKEHSITVDIFQNSGKKNLNAVVTQYMANWNAKYGSDEEIKINGDVVTRWDMNVWKYVEQLIGGTINGYVVVTDDYIYEVSYFISETPAESYQVALKVLDSMKFGTSSDLATTVSVVYRGEGSSISSDYSNYVYFEKNGSDNTEVYLVLKSGVTLDSSKIGKTYSLTYSDATSSGVAAGTSYWKVSGTFTYVQQ